MINNKNCNFFFLPLQDNRLGLPGLLTAATT